MVASRDFWAASFTVPVHFSERALVGELDGEVGQSVRPAAIAGIAIRPPPSTLVKDSLKLVAVSKRGESDVELLAGQVKRSRAMGPSTRGRRATTSAATFARSFIAAQRPGTRRGLSTDRRPLNPPLRLPCALERDPDRTERSCKADAAVGNVERRGWAVGTACPIGGGRSLSIWPQLTFPWTRRPRSRTPRAKTRNTSKLPSHFSRIWMIRVARREVRPPGIADDEVMDFLGAKADPVEMVAGLDSAPLELAFEEMGRDRPPLDPHHRDDDDQRSDQPERDKARKPPPAIAIVDERFAAVHALPHPRLSAPPLGLTNPCSA